MLNLGCWLQVLGLGVMQMDGHRGDAEKLERLIILFAVPKRPFVVKLSTKTWN